MLKKVTLIGLKTRFGLNWWCFRCGARTKTGSAGQRSPVNALK